MGFSEGTGNDWLASAMVEGHRTSIAVGSLSFALFVAAMTLGRWFGPPLVERYGPRLVTRVSVVLALMGLGTTVFGPNQASAVIGVVGWGLGTAMGFPLGISGPPLLGFFADHVGILRSLSVTMGVVAAGLLLTVALPRTK
ncbi:MFS transporter [Cryptosporangium sp. NPDC048952]|uniref:MFS transporter n=1 Tax=Cryptosporangium sp. NPDC048952 TaxID=3363961 RepID=UPI0037194125